MATKTNNNVPKINKKWYTLTIDSKTLRPIRFAWMLASGKKSVMVYDDLSIDRSEIHDINLRRCVTSFYFVPDTKNKRIFIYPVLLANNDTRSNCKNARYEKLNTYCFYMIDENKQVWEIPYEEYCRRSIWSPATRTYEYETIKATPKKKNRLSTYYYKIQCQRTDYIRKIFSELYGSDFVYQNRLVSDADIRENSWLWYSWINTKGRKYSEKTIKSVDEIMSKFSSQQRSLDSDENKITLETRNGITAICYFSKGYEVFRSIFNSKTGKTNYFIWKQGKWQKSGKLTRYQTVYNFTIDDTYRKENAYDCKFLDEAYQYYKSSEDRRGYWHSSDYALYKFTQEYITHPVMHQILQIMSETERYNIYQRQGIIESVFGKIPNKGKTMFSKLGVNRYQFSNPDIIVYMKWLLDTNNISHIDDTAWDRYTVAFAGLNPGRDYRDREIIQYLKSVGEFSIDRWIKICKLDKTEQIKCGNSYYYSQVKQLYKDYYNVLLALREFGVNISSYPLLFNDRQQLQRYHDEASTAMSSVKNKAQDEKFEMLYNQRTKMLENDGKYLIDMPKCPSDIAEEGSKLHHCVGGYVNAIANGNTTIYFLRQASAPDVPWLTVEVRNKHCMQIHGSYNAWMGSRDEYFDAVPFLVWWFEKHGIECNDNLLTNMATGYGKSSSRRDMPTTAIEAYKASKKNKK